LSVSSLKVPIAFARRAPLSSRASASQKAVDFPPWRTLPSAADHAVVPAHRPAHDEIEHGHDHPAVSRAPAVQELGALLQRHHRVFFRHLDELDPEMLGERDLDAGRK